jgi:hypothetical protein
MYRMHNQPQINNPIPTNINHFNPSINFETHIIPPVYENQQNRLFYPQSTIYPTVPTVPTVPIFTRPINSNLPNEEITKLNNKINALENEIKIIKSTYNSRINTLHKKFKKSINNKEQNEDEDERSTNIFEKINKASHNLNSNISRLPININNNIKDNNVGFSSVLPPIQPTNLIMISTPDKKSDDENDNDNYDNELIDSEDDVDYSYNIYSENIISNTLDKDIINIEITDKSIRGLIDLGNKYKDSKRKKILERSKKTENKKETSNIMIENPLMHIMNAIATKLNKETEKKETMKETMKQNNKVKTEIKYYTYNSKKYNIDIEKIVNLITPLTKLQQTIGMTKVKEHIIDMILYYIQGFETQTSNMLHTTIEGPPGIGKSRLGRILAQIYSSMGLIPTSKFKRVRRTDLIGKYLGHTAHKTQEVIDEADGGVLFIDEAYSLGNAEREDMYAKECIDTINMNLSEKKKNLIVIIAGYPNQLESSFFSLNEGLKRRFPFRFIIDEYNEKEMKDIFYNQVRRLRWRLDKEVNETYLESFFKQNKDKFTNFGGDIETMLLNCKFTHAKRVIGLDQIFKKVINIKDLELAYNKFIDGKKKENDISISTKMMYM